MQFCYIIKAGVKKLLIDVHAHLYDKNLIGRIDEIISNAKKNRVRKIICVSDNPNSAKCILNLSEKYKNIYACLGVHPCEEKTYTNEFADFLTNNKHNEKIVGIGEIGLDYHYEPFDKERQIFVFLEQLKLASLLKLPVQLHCRDAMKDMLDLLIKNKQLLKYGGIMHCFNGSLSDLKVINELGLKISIGGVATFKNAKTFQELISEIPLDLITFETDCPYLSPHPLRGKINEPKNLLLTAEKVADLKHLTLDEIIKISTENCLQVFKKLK